MSPIFPRQTGLRPATLIRAALYCVIAIVTGWATFTSYSAKVADTREASSVSANPISANKTKQAPQRINLDQEFGKLPLSFEANTGQTDPNVKYFARGPGYNIFFTPEEAVIVLPGRVGAGAISAAAEDEASPADNELNTNFSERQKALRRLAARGAVSPTVVRMRLEGADVNARAIRGDDRLPGKVNYFFGNDSSKWTSDVPTYGEVSYSKVYPGIDLVYYGNRQQIEYDLIVAPGADPNVIQFAIDGIEGLRIDKGGDLVLKTKAGELRQLKPTIYQDVDGVRKKIKGSYVLRAGNKVGFRVTRYDRGRQLVIDPILKFLHLVNGSGEGIAITTDAAGHSYFTGVVFNASLNATPGAYQIASGGGSDAFVTKLSPNGNTVLYTTYLGGSGDDYGNGVSIDANGNAYIAGFVAGTFPTTPGAFQTLRQGVGDGFITKLNPAGNGLVFSTLFGGNGNEEVDNIVIDSSGEVYFSGLSASSNLPTTPGAFRTIFSGGFDGFAGKMNATGTGISYLTYIGGGGFDYPTDMAGDSAGNVYLAGQTSSLNFPTQNPIQAALGGPARGLFKSTNGGSNWGLSSTNLPTTYVLSIAINPTTPSTIYIGTDGGVYKSTNSGATWAPTGAIPSRFVRQLLIDPTATNTVYAGTETGVYKSTNGGSNWTLSSNGLILPNISVDIRGLALAPSVPNVIYAAALGGVFKTTDGGANWTAINTGLPAFSTANTNGIVVDPSAPNTAYVAIASANRIYKTTNGGASWVASSTGLPNSNVNTIAINPTVPGTLFVGNNVGVYRSTNNGANWTAVNTGLQLPRSDGGTSANPIIFGLALDPTTPNTIYAAPGTTAPADGSFFTFATIFKSTDAGNTWTAQTTGLNNAFTAFSSIAVDPSNSANLYIGSFGDTDAFVLKLNAAGSAAAFSTYLGGDRVDAAGSVAVDSANNVYLSGSARLGFPTTPGAFQTVLKGLADHFVVKLNAGGTSLAYATYLGGADVENAVGGLAIDGLGNAHVLSGTFSADFPVTPGAFQGTIGNPGTRNSDVFVAKLNPAGSGLAYSTFLGGGGNDVVNGFLGNRLSLDGGNNVFILGVTASGNFPSTKSINSGPTGGTTFVGKIAGNIASYSIAGRIATSGNVGISGVYVSATNSLGEDHYGLTDAQGFYAIISLPTDNYTVTPSRYAVTGHYIYAPPTQTFNGLSSDQTANFTATAAYDISGSVNHGTIPGLGIFDVTINVTGTVTRSVVTNASGFYSILDLPAGNYTVTPAKAGFTFTPPNRVFNSLASDQFADFTTVSGSFFSVSGRIATPANASISGATVSMLLTTSQGVFEDSATTDANGNYSFPNLQAGGNYSFLAAKPLLSFTPFNPTFPNLSGNQTVNFTSAPVTGLIGKIAFIAGFAGDLSVMNADTTGEVILTVTNAGSCSSGEAALAWSPDGSRIAFSRCEGDENSNLYTIKSDGTNVTQLTNDPELELFPSWSPDATQITYSHGACSGSDQIDPEIFTTNLTGSIRAQLTNNSIIDAFSDWSPNGSRIVFARTNSTECSSVGEVSDLFVMDQTGGNQQQLTNTSAGESVPAYSPDGSKIAYIQQNFDLVANAFTSNVYVMNSDGTNKVKLTPDTINAYRATWSPDGTKLAFQAELAGLFLPSQLFVINADGTGLAQLTSGANSRESPAWQHYSISGHVTGNTDGPVTMVLAGTLSRVTRTDANGDYVFGNLTPGGNYSVTPVSTAFTFTPATADVNNLIGNQIADFTVLPALPAPTPPLTDEFGGPQRDPTKWNLGTLTQPMLAFDPLVTVVQQNGQLVITPRTNLSGLHYNGYVSVNSFDFSNATATVQVSQVANNGADTIFAIGTDLDNFTRFVVREGGTEPDMYNPTQTRPRGSGVAQLIFQVRIGGQLTSFSIPYNSTQHAYMRFRHDPLDNAIVFETSPNDKDFVEQHRVVLQRSVSAMSAELSAGTSTPTNPGSASFNSFQLVTNTFQFGPPIIMQADANAGEGDGRVNLTITRVGSSASAASVEFITRDTAGLQNCNVFNGVASSRCDYATSIGTVVFEAGQTAKTISVPLVDDGFAEGPETFTVTVRNATGAGIGTPSRSVVSITDNDPATGANPIDTTPFFVRQQYVDFLSREPDPAGFAGWQTVINNCPPGDITCDRIHVSSAFFRSAEFQGRGYFIYRFYPVAFGRKPDYNEFMPDLAKVSGFLSDQQLEAAKVAFITEFMSRQAFKAKFDSLTDTQYVDTLLATAAVTSPHRDFWIAALGNGTRTRATVLRDISESIEVYNKYFNQAFVVMQYFGYLRRDPDAFYLNWIDVLESTGDFRGMVNGFSNSLEYRFRFGQ